MPCTGPTPLPLSTYSASSNPMAHTTNSRAMPLLPTAIDADVYNGPIQKNVIPSPKWDIRPFKKNMSTPPPPQARTIHINHFLFSVIHAM